MTVIYKDVKTLAEIQSVTGQQTKALVMYDASTGEAAGLDVEVLINLDADKADTTQVEALDAEKVDKTQSVLAGAGMTGGGDLSAARTFNVVSADDGITVNANDIKLNIVNDLTTSSATRAISATQVKTLNDQINSDIEYSKNITYSVGANINTSLNVALTSYKNKYIRISVTGDENQVDKLTVVCNTGSYVTLGEVYVEGDVLEVLVPDNVISDSLIIQNTAKGWTDGGTLVFSCINKEAIVSRLDDTLRLSNVKSVIGNGIDTTMSQRAISGLSYLSVPIRYNGNYSYYITGSFKEGETIGLLMREKSQTINGGTTAIYVSDGTNNYCIYNTADGVGYKESVLLADSDNLSIVVYGNYLVTKLEGLMEFLYAEKLETYKKAQELQTIIVAADGSGDYTSLAEAVLYATQFSNCKVYVMAGTYNLIDEFEDYYGQDFFTNYTSASTSGLILKNNVSLIFSQLAKVTFNYTGDNDDVMIRFSPFNAGTNGFSIEGAIIECSNCRYALHDERSINTDLYVNRIKGCSMKIDNSGNTAWASKQCVGGGLGINGMIYVENCVFESIGASGTDPLVSYHNTSAENAKSVVHIMSNYFKGLGTFRLTWYGVSTLITTAYVSNNSLGAALIHEAETAGSTTENTELISWNNEVRS